MSEKKDVFTVSEINRYIKGKLQVDPHLRRLWVGGELSNFKWHRSGHMYFTIKDKYSSLRCVYFRKYNRSCPFLPSDGMEVWIRGNISVYEKEGLYQLYVEEMEPAGVGSLHLAFEQLKERLQEEGLFDTRYKKKIPRFPWRIALLTSPSGAALQDIISTAQRRFPHVTFRVVETLVQGTYAPSDIIKSLRYVENNEEVDLVILTRGGGSLEELWAFNDEDLARAVFDCSTPVVSAVGHETDFSITDFVADLRASTPTGAVEMVLPAAEEIQHYLQDAVARCRAALESRTSREKQRLEYARGRRFVQLPRQLLESKSRRLEELRVRMERAVKDRLKQGGYRLSSLEERLESLSPLNIMERGYTYCEDEEGHLIGSVEEIKVGQKINIHFRDGRAGASVEEVEVKEGESSNERGK